MVFVVDIVDINVFVVVVVVIIVMIAVKSLFISLLELGLTF